MRCMDILLAIPNILLAITIVAALGASNLNLIIALTISSVPGFSRIVRGAAGQSPAGELPSDWLRRLPVCRCLHKPSSELPDVRAISW